VVLDFVDVIIHVMRKDLRDRYDLETLWGDAPRLRSRRRTSTVKPSKTAEPGLK